MVRQPTRLIALFLLTSCGLHEAPEPRSTTHQGLLFRLQQAGPVERWKTLEGHEAAFERRSGRLQWRSAEGKQEKIRTRLSWANWGLLEECLGSPIRERTGGDPGAFRNLHIVERKASWVLKLSGLNRCSLGGRVIVDAVQDRVETSELTVDGIAWAAGGRHRARAILRAETRDLATDRWMSLDTVGRILLLKRLSDDPDPRAEDSLRALKALDPSHTRDIEAALERRQLRLNP